MNEAEEGLIQSDHEMDNVVKEVGSEELSHHSPSSANISPNKDNESSGSIFHHQEGGNHKVGGNSHHKSS